MKAEYNEKEFHEWLKENNWYPYGPQAAHNPKYDPSKVGEWVHKGPPHSDHKTTEELYTMYADSKSEKK